VSSSLGKKSYWELYCHFQWKNPDIEVLPTRQELGELPDSNYNILRVRHKPQMFALCEKKKMRQNDFSALDPLGKALLAYWRGDESTQITQEYRSGRKKLIPASVFFRNIENFYPTEDVFSYCHGRILVVGAGTGVHVLELELQGYEVTAVEVNPQAVQIMKERGVKDIRHCDFFEFSGELYETILMLGHNIGICETVDRIKILLQRCKSLLVPYGQLLVNSVDESVSSDVKKHNGYLVPGRKPKSAKKSK
jgi:2-polyprenyl-3-methyl-5-hydroxy-6-metoxy-1,4-benzoquinol methylase